MNQADMLEIDHAFQQIVQANELLARVWRADMLWSWQWWTVVFFTVAPWAVWFFLRPKQGKGRLLCAGFFNMLAAGWMDAAGINFGLWRYHIEVVPIIPAFIPWDYAMYPVATMLLIQYGKGLSPHIQAGIFAGAASFVVEPFFTWLGLYVPLQWQSIYSFPIHFALYHIAYLIALKLEYQPISR